MRQLKRSASASQNTIPLYQDEVVHQLQLTCTCILHADSRVKPAPLHGICELRRKSLLSRVNRLRNNAAEGQLKAEVAEEEKERFQYVHSAN